jgi:hypothetical protein
LNLESTAGVSLPSSFFCCLQWESGTAPLARLIEFVIPGCIQLGVQGERTSWVRSTKVASVLDLESSFSESWVLGITVGPDFFQGATFSTLIRWLNLSEGSGFFSEETCRWECSWKRSRARSSSSSMGSFIVSFGMIVT